jgi:hypothetical protein
MHRFLVLLAVVMIASGLLWTAQGSGVFPYPARSFMIGSRPWIGWGLLLAAVGGLVLWMAIRPGR